MMRGFEMVSVVELFGKCLDFGSEVGIGLMAFRFLEQEYLAMIAKFVNLESYPFYPSF